MKSYEPTQSFFDINYAYLHFIPELKPKYNFTKTSKLTSSNDYFEPFGRHEFWPFLACSLIHAV